MGEPKEGQQVIGTMALIVIFLLLVAAVGIGFLRRAGREAELAARELPVVDRPELPES